jgi:two-component system, OmpR family, response regulator
VQNLCKPTAARFLHDNLQLTMSEILVVDDDGHIREVLRFALERAGHRVREASDGRAALQAANQRMPDLIVLDIVMPEADGLATCRELRKHSRVPIIFLSSRDEELDRVLGLELGGDDYISKPFSPRELVARVSAVLRRLQPQAATTAQPDAQLESGGLRLDLVRHRCHVAERELILTVTEFELLRVLLSAPGRVFERAQLIEQAYGDDHHVTERTVDSHVRRLRKKLADAGADPIETVYGIGYRLREAGTP